MGRVRDFLRAAASILDLGGTPGPEPSIQPDAEALKSDGQTVGDDLWSALGRVRT